MRQSAARLEPVTVVGRHCEAGDVLAADIPLAADIRPGDFIVVPGTGGYTYSMASNYNIVERPPMVAMLEGAARCWCAGRIDERPAASGYRSVRTAQVTHPYLVPVRESKQGLSRCRPAG